MKTKWLIFTLFVSINASAITDAEHEQAIETKNTTIQYFNVKVADVTAIAEACEKKWIKTKNKTNCAKQWETVNEWTKVRQAIIDKPLDFFIDEYDDYDVK